jgi:alpha-beta hydrolase superfamily lysophospholipase
MKRLMVVLLLAIFPLLDSCITGSKTAGTENEPFSFEEVGSMPEIGMPETKFLTASDVVRLAYYDFKPESEPTGSLVFYHGGGAWSGASYQFLAEGLSRKYGIRVYLVDIRGHGNSGGPRGDSPTVAQVWDDISLMIRFVRTDNGNLPVFVGGHSSGGGLVLNYLSQKSREPVDGYVFISPFLGYRSGTERKNKTGSSFSSVDEDVFVRNAISRGAEDGNTPAVFFNYPERILEQQPLFIKYITCNMSLSLTPWSPEKQFRSIDKPFVLMIGENDELLLADKVLKFADLADPRLRKVSTVVSVPEKNHLSILLGAEDVVGLAIRGFP